MINIADLAKSHTNDPKSYVWTSCLITLAVVMLFIQAAVHQEWEDENRGRTGQILMLCLASNGVGLVLLYSFVRMKVSGNL